ncbi:MAG: tail fiber domain-containing protein [Candidatus Kapaibacterium sp.]
MRTRTACSFLGLASIVMATAFSPLSAQWLTSGNVVTNPTDVLGAINTADLSMITDNIERLRITSSGLITTVNGSGIDVNGGALNVNGGGLNVVGNLTSNGGPISLNSNGPVDIIGNSGPMNINNTGGPLMLHNFGGPFDIGNNSGPFAINNNGGPLLIANNGGPFDLNGNGGPMNISNNGGPLSLNSNSNPLDINSAGGPATINTNGGPFDANTSNGPIDFNMGTGIFTVNGDVFINGNGVVSGTWTVSDARYKTNVLQLDNALAKVMSLRGVGYDWKRAEFPNMRFPQGHQVGFIAQELEKVVPEAVHTDADGYKSVAYQNLTALLTEAIKEQQAEIQLLQAKVARLESALGKQDPSGQMNLH